MKKILFAVVALVAMASCATEEIVSSAAPEAIGFDSAFVDNSTRSNYDPSYTNTKLFPDFAAFAHVNGAVLFNNKAVTGSGINGTWTYDGTQYWVKNAKYNFAAIAPKTVTGGGYWNNAVTSVNGDYSAITTEFDFRSTSATDLLYAEVENITGKASGNSKIGFSFRHLLSKVKFSFKNDYSTEAFSIKVYDIRIENAYLDGHVKVTKNATEWTASTDSGNYCPILVGNVNVDGTTDHTVVSAFTYGTTLESHNECFLIPGAVPGGYEVTFKVDLLVGETLIDTYEHSAIVDFAPAPGMAYDINAVINHENIDPSTEQEAIEFTVTEIENWDQYTNVDATVMTSVATEAELKAAVAAGENVKLAADINLATPLRYAPVTRATTINEFVVDLNDHDLIAETTDAIVIEGNANLTINGNGNVKAATNDASSANALWVKYGNVVINGGNYYVGADNALRNDCIYLGAAAYKNDAANYPSSIVINGGTFETKVAEKGQYWVLNVQDDFYSAGSTIVVNGGSFKNFDPANNLSEGANTNFLAAGKTSTQNAEGWFVVE